MDGVEFALENWGKGLNCAEAVLRGVCHEMRVDLDGSALKMATPFGGGIGGSEDLCGAVAGATMAIGAMMGRTTHVEDKKKCAAAAGEFHKLFVEGFGSTSCRVLNKSDFTSPEHKERCTEFVKSATAMAIRTLKNGR